jgi:hypothetical protein
MPKPREGQNKDEYISYCISYIKKNEPNKADWSDGRLYKHCAELWNKYKKSANSNIVSKLNTMGYMPFAFTAFDNGMIRMDKGSISLSSIKTETKFEDEENKQNPRDYDVVDAIAAIGDRFYGNIYVSSDVLRKSASAWNGTYHDLSHLATMFPAGLGAIENMEYIVGYNSDAKFDESINGVRVKFHINHNAPKYQVWKNFVDISRDAGRVPNVSIFGFIKAKTMSASKLPKGTHIPSGASQNGNVIVMDDLIPFAITTCLQGKCNDKDGCGLASGYTENGKEVEITADILEEDKEEKNEVKKVKKELSKERQERLKYLNI